MQENSIILGNMQLFPNPAEEYVYVQCQNNHKNIRGQVQNIQGQVVQEFVVNHKVTKLSISELPQGVYFVKTEGYKVQKLVKQ